MQFHASNLHESVCFHMCWRHLTDEKREGLGPTRDRFPQSVVKTCSLLRAGGNNTPQPANFICCHFLTFTPSPPKTQQCATPTSHSAPLHACEAEIGCNGLSKVSKLSPLPRMFSLSVYFSSVIFWEWKNPQTSWFYLFFLGIACGLRQFQVGTGEERASETKDKSRDTACIWRMLMH